MRKLLIALGILFAAVALRPTPAEAQSSEVWASDWITRDWHFIGIGNIQYPDGTSMGNHPLQGEFIGVIARYYDVNPTEQHANGSQVMSFDFRDQVPNSVVGGSFTNYGGLTWSVQNDASCYLRNVRSFSGLPNWQTDASTICAEFGVGDETIDLAGSNPSVQVSGQARNGFGFHWSNQDVEHTGTFQIRYLYYGVPLPNASFTPDPDEGNYPLEVAFTNTSTLATSYDWDFGDESAHSSETDPTHTYDEPGFYTVTLTATNATGSDVATAEINVTSPFGSIGGGGRPLGPYDRVDWEGTYEGMWDYSGMSPGAPTPPIYAGALYRVFAIANSQEAPVLSVGEGSVISVSPASSVSDCSVYTGQSSTWAGPFGECYLFVAEQVAPDAAAIMFRVDRSDAYEVVIDTATGNTIRYYVKNPRVSLGDTIAGGCIIGDTLPLLNLTAAELESIALGISSEGIGIGPSVSLESETDISFTAVDLTGGNDRLLNLLTQDFDPQEACNVNPLYATCLGDGQLREPEAWVSTGVVQWNASGSGAVLQPGATIAQTLRLGTGEYELNVRARRLGVQSTQLLLQLGETVIQSEARYELGTYSIPIGEHEPDAGQLYTVAITNLGNAPMEILSACVSDGNGGEALGTCGFSNPSFDYGLTSWGHNGDVFLGLTDGDIWMEDATSIYQDIRLYPNGTQSYEYTVVVETRLPLDFAAIEGEVSFTWDYGGSSGDFLSPASTTTYSFAQYFARSGPIPGWSSLIEFSAQVEVATAQDGPFTVYAHIDDAPADIGITVTQVCIRDPFAHHPSTTGGEKLPFEINCSRVPIPAGDGIDEWIFYHWSNLDRFFQCDLMILMNRIWNTAYKTYQTLQWMGLYGQASMDKIGRWFGNVLFPWLNGHFRNMAVGQVTTFIEGEGGGGGGCTDIWCVLEALINTVFGPLIASVTSIVDTLLSIIEQASSLLFTIVSTLLALALSLINRLLGLGVLGQEILGTLLTAYNSSPALPIPGIPDCSINPPEGICSGIWVVDNTVFSPGQPGAIIPGLLTALMSIHLLIFVVARIRHLILSVGRSI